MDINQTEGQSPLGKPFPNIAVTPEAQKPSLKKNYVWIALVVVVAVVAFAAMVIWSYKHTAKPSQGNIPPAAGNPTKVTGKVTSAPAVAQPNLNDVKTVLAEKSKIQFPTMSKITPVTAEGIPSGDQVFLVGNPSPADFRVIQYADGRLGSYQGYSLASSLLADVLKKISSQAAAVKWEAFNTLSQTSFSIVEFKQSDSSAQAQIMLFQTGDTVQVIAQTIEQ